MSDNHVHRWTGATYRDITMWCPDCDMSELEYLRERVAEIERGTRKPTVSDLDLDAIEEAHIHTHRPCAIAALIAEVRALREQVIDTELNVEGWQREYEVESEEHAECEKYIATLEGGIRENSRCDQPIGSGGTDQPTRIIGRCGMCEGCTVWRRTSALLDASHDQGGE